MKIVLDAMGGDHAPAVTVHGAVWAARDFDLEVQLVGRPEVIQAELAKHDTAGLALPIIPAGQVIEMDDNNPANSVKIKKDSSMVVGVEWLKAGRTDGFVTMGNSGGALAAALLYLGRIPGIKRPAISTLYPTASPHGFCFLLDIGANADCKPEYLYQFALMGSAYTARVLGIPNPRVAIVSNGEEEGKGNMLVQDTLPLLRNGPLNFVGNVEGKDVPAGLADVVVTDGFTGNVIVKLSEGVATMLLDAIKREIKARPLATLGAALAKPAFKAVGKMLDYREFGGGALLGVNGVVIVGHGRSDAYAVRNSIRNARQAVDSDVIGAIRVGLEATESQISNIKYQMTNDKHQMTNDKHQMTNDK
jgi:glycerol-3-phosphate acyltransferase PlsX